MIHESICTYEVAKLAKEKGFDWICPHYFRTKNKDLFRVFPCEDWSDIEDRINAPTQSLLQRWLREEKKWNIVVRMYNNEGYYWFIQNSKGELQESYFTYADEMFATYELALEDALKYALENLV